MDRAEKERERKNRKWASDAEFREHRKLYMRERSARLKAAGLCPICQKKMDTKGWACLPCRYKESTKKKARYATRYKQYFHDRYLWKKEHGLCVSCARPLPEDSKYVNCPACRKKQRENRRVKICL